MKLKIRKFAAAFAAGALTLFAAAAAAWSGTSVPEACRYVKESAAEVCLAAMQHSAQAALRLRGWLLGLPSQPIAAATPWSGFGPGSPFLQARGVSSDRRAARSLCEHSGILLHADRASLARILRSGEYRGSG